MKQNLQQKKTIWSCAVLSCKWMGGFDWKSPGGVKYRVAYTANNSEKVQFMHMLYLF